MPIIKIPPQIQLHAPAASTGQPVQIEVVLDCPARLPVRSIDLTLTAELRRVDLGIPITSVLAQVSAALLTEAT